MWPEPSFRPAHGSERQFPLITDNLDFAGDTALKAQGGQLARRHRRSLAGLEASVIKGKIAPSTVVTINGEKIGIVGATTWDLLTKTSPNGTIVKDDGNAATDKLHETAAYVQAAVNGLTAAGVNKIVMVDQLDTIDRNKDLAPLVSGIDVMVAGGGHERLGDANDTAFPFNGHSATFAGTYPQTATALDGKPMLIVTTDTEYTYLGRLVVGFDSSGVLDVTSLDSSSMGRTRPVSRHCSPSTGRPTLPPRSSRPARQVRRSRRSRVRSTRS